MITGPSFFNSIVIMVDGQILVLGLLLAAAIFLQTVMSIETLLMRIFDRWRCLELIQIVVIVGHHISGPDVMVWCWHRMFVALPQYLSSC